MASPLFCSLELYGCVGRLTTSDIKLSGNGLFRLSP